MATYALTFATRAAFDTSLASGDIYNLMQGVTSSKPSVAITATITESGETFACGTNVMIDIKSVGPGDRIMYESTNEDNPATGVFKGRFFGIASKWIDNNYPAQPTQHIMIFKTGVLPARYVDCGVCVRRFGNRIRIAGESTTTYWSSSTNRWDVPTIPYTNYTFKKSRTSTTAINASSTTVFPSLRYLEAMFPTADNTYMPITRAAWDAAIAAGSATVSGGGKTVTLADYDYSFDKFQAYNWSPLFPAPSGSYSDVDGRGNTRKIVAEFIENHGKTENSTDYAAGYCYNYTKSAPGLGKHSWFLGTMKDVGEYRALSHALSTAVAWGTGYSWSSSQNTSNDAWLYTYRGNINPLAKTSTAAVIPLADLILEN